MIESFLQRGIAAVLAAAFATMVARYFCQLATLRTYAWMVTAATVIGYALVFVLVLWGVRGLATSKQFALIQPFAIVFVFCCADVLFRIVNCGFDRAPPVERAAQVMGYDRYKAAYFITVSAPPELDRSKLMVPEGVYRGAMEGKPVVITLRPGLLGAAWTRRGDITTRP